MIQACFPAKEIQRQSNDNENQRMQGKHTNETDLGDAYDGVQIHERVWESRSVLRGHAEEGSIKNKASVWAYPGPFAPDIWPQEQEGQDRVVQVVGEETPWAFLEAAAQSESEKVLK